VFLLKQAFVAVGYMKAIRASGLQKYFHNNCQKFTVISLNWSNT